MKGIRVCSTLCLFILVCGITTASEQQTAQDILNATGVKGGLIVHVGCGDGKLTAALCVNDSYVVHGLDTDAGNVTKARENIRSAGLYGARVSIDRLMDDRLPYVDNLVNLLVSEDPGKISIAEVLRVLAPDGVAYIRDGERWMKTTKPRPAGIDEWTHYLHDATGNAVANDTVIGPPRHLQWVGSPRWSRHHDRMASMSALVSANGRIFYIMDEGSRASIELPPKWTLIGRDAFNGVILWKRSIPDWYPHIWPFKSGHAQLPRRLIAVGDKVYVTLGLNAPLSVLDAATGETIRTYEKTRGTEEILMSDGVLFLVINESEAPTTQKPYAPVHRGIGKAKTRVEKEWPWNKDNRVIMAVKPDTGELIWKQEYPVAPLTMAIDDENVYFCKGEEIVCLDRLDGSQVWISEPVSKRSIIPSKFGQRLIVYRDYILFAGGDKSVSGLSAKTGEKLWTAEHHPSGHNSPQDLLVVDGLVWYGATAGGRHSGVFTGRDPKTGEIKNEFLPNVKTYWFHQRCYPSKATVNYILPSRTGIEFVDFREQDWTINHWVRGGCLYGIMPCNGMVYAPPHDCACYPEAKLYGFNALAPASSTRPKPGIVSDAGRLERGPAYDETIEEASEGKAEWPTYRCDSMRSGCTSANVPADLKEKWKANMTGRLSSVVVADGKVFLARVDNHTVHALDANTGDMLWDYSAGGRVDSPPTIYKGRVFFGSSDGWIYALRASDGALIWRFRAAPVDLRLMSFEQLESVWPVHGSVLIHKDVLYCVAGRSLFLDGGMRLLRLDPITGKKLSESVMDDREPETNADLQDRLMILNMPVGLPDILSTDGKYVYLKSQKFDMRGVRQELGPHSGKPVDQGSVQTGEGVHLFCPTGFLDDEWFHRSYWVYGRSFAGGHGGYYQAGRFAPAGRLLVLDDSTVYGFGRKPKYFTWTTPMEFHLFAADKDVKLVESVNNKGQKVKKGEINYRWTKSVPVQVWAMAMADKTFFVAGPPDVLDEEDAFDRYLEADIQAKLKEQDDILNGKKGAILMAVSAEDGEQLAEYKLDSIPVFDGMAVADNQIYISTKDGQILCFSGSK